MKKSKTQKGITVTVEGNPVVIMDGEIVQGVIFTNDRQQFLLRRSARLSDGTIVFPCSRFRPIIGKAYDVTIRRNKRNQQVATAFPSLPELLSEKEWVSVEQLKRDVLFEKGKKDGRPVGRCSDTGKYIIPDRFWEDVKAGKKYLVVLVDRGSCLIAFPITGEESTTQLTVMLNEQEVGKVFFNGAYLEPHLVLKVPEDADEKTIKSAFRSLSKIYHPDKRGGNLTSQAKDLLAITCAALKRAQDMMLANLNGGNGKDKEE